MWRMEVNEVMVVSGVRLADRCGRCGRCGSGGSGGGGGHTRVGASSWGKVLISMEPSWCALTDNGAKHFDGEDAISAPNSK